MELFRATGTAVPTLSANDEKAVHVAVGDAARVSGMGKHVHLPLTGDVWNTSAGLCAFSCASEPCGTRTMQPCAVETLSRYTPSGVSTPSFTMPFSPICAQSEFVLIDCKAQSLTDRLLRISVQTHPYQRRLAPRHEAGSLERALPEPNGRHVRRAAHRRDQQHQHPAAA